MRSAIIVSSLIALAAPAWAQSSFLSCVDQTQSWTAAFSAGQVQFVTFVPSMPLQPAPPRVWVRPLPNSFGWLIAAKRSGGINTTEILIAMPTSTAQQYQRLTNADAQFDSDKRRFHELLLIDGTACPLLIEDAAYSPTGAPLWTH